MADSDITVDGLAATSGATQIALTWNPQSDPYTPGSLPYLQFDQMEIWVATSNSRGSATQLGETNANSFVHTGLTAGVTRYYWIRPRNRSGLYGDWHPLSASAGVNATTVASLSQISTALGGIVSGSLGAATTYLGNLSASQIITGTLLAARIGALTITTDKLAAGAVTTDKLDAGAVTADKITVTQLSSISANLGTITAGVMLSTTISGGTITGGTISGTSITGVTITGGTLRTASSGTRIQITDSLNAMQIFNGSTEIGRIGYGGTGAFVVNVSASVTGAVANIDNTSGGQLGIAFAAGAGGYAAFAGSGTYGPFTGSHDGLMRKTHDAEIGDIVVDTRIIARKSVSNTLSEIEPSSSPRMKTIIGVVAHRNPILAQTFAVDIVNADYADDFDHCVVNACGEGQVNVCGENGSIEAGDFITTSSVPGKGMKQDDDIVHSYTVARAREAADLAPGDTAMIACVYLCG